MKRMKIMVAAIALCGLAACSDNTPKSFTGTITDASMNTVTVENAEGTFTFSTMDADKSEANGLLLGAPVVVDYKGKLEDGAAAAKVATDPTYAEAVGKWTMPDPIDLDDLTDDQQADLRAAVGWATPTEQVRSGRTRSAIWRAFWFCRS